MNKFSRCLLHDKHRPDRKLLQKRDKYNSFDCSCCCCAAGAAAAAVAIITAIVGGESMENNFVLAFWGFVQVLKNQFVHQCFYMYVGMRVCIYVCVYGWPKFSILHCCTNT